MSPLLYSSIQWPGHRRAASDMEGKHSFPAKRRRKCAVTWALEALENRVILSAATGGISGAVFNDANDNGVQDAGEAGLAGQQVFVDLQGPSVKSYRRGSRSRARTVL
jgi:hypothetical protein